MDGLTDHQVVLHNTKTNKVLKRSTWSTSNRYKSGVDDKVAGVGEKVVGVDSEVEIVDDNVESIG